MNYAIRNVLIELAAYAKVTRQNKTGVAVKIKKKKKTKENNEGAAKRSS